MNPNNTVCNYAMLRFTPYPRTGEVVNVGIVVSCINPCFLHFLAEAAIPTRLKTLFPEYEPDVFTAAVVAMEKERLFAELSGYNEPD